MTHRSTLALLCVGSLGLAGCGMFGSLSSVNPFDGPAPVATPTGPIDPLVPERKVTQVVDQRAPAASITGVQRDRTEGGVIVTAFGLAARPGAFNAELRFEGRSGTTLRYSLVMQYPQQATGSGRPSVTAATFIPDAQLDGVRSIVVQGQSGSRSVRP